MHPYFHHTANDKRYLTNTVVLDHIGALPLLPLFLGKRIKHPDLSRTLSTGDQSETGKDEKTEGKEGGRRERERERDYSGEMADNGKTEKDSKNKRKPTD